MGSEKRKKCDRHGARGKASYDKPKPSITDLELEERKDADQFELGHLGIVGGDSDEDRVLDGDPPMQEPTEDLNQTGIAGDELDESRGRSAYLVACHWDWSRYSKPYAVYNVGITATATSSPPRPKRKRLRRITRLPTTAGGKSFTSVRSIHILVIVMSYVVVDAYILVSFNQPWGTYAFDTNSLKWHKVDDKRLPFTGCAVPHGSVFLGLSKDNGPISAYRINVTTSDQDHDPCLSITVLLVKYMENEVDAGSCFFSLEDELFCSLSFSLDSSSVIRSKDLDFFPAKAHVDLRTYQTENTSLLEAPEETLLAVKPEVTVCSQWKQAFKISCSSHGFSPFAFALLSI